MPSITPRRSVRNLALGLGSVAAVLATAAGVQAQEINFFDMLFGGARPAPVQPAYDPYRAQRRAERRARAARVRRPDTRYAALPREDAMTGKQPVDAQAIHDDPKGVLLKDPTLRAGDIVVMPSGPKVFTGAPARTHRMSEFEDVRHSRFLDTKTRAQLVAMMMPVGAMTPEQARKVMSVRLKLAPPDEAPTAEAANTTPEARAEPTGPRVIAPWTGATP